MGPRVPLIKEYFYSARKVSAPDLFFLFGCVEVWCACVIACQKIDIKDEP